MKKYIKIARPDSLDQAALLYFRMYVRVFAGGYCKMPGKFF